MADDAQTQTHGDGNSIDILFFGSHPDDVEWGAGGTALKLKNSGTSFGIVDLTRGEMGSRGTSEQRGKEAADAASWMGARFRENLGLPDCGITDSVENRKLVASVIRKWRPKLVLAPYWTDRHPDHAATGNLVRNAAVFCALKKSDDPTHLISLRLICTTSCITTRSQVRSSTFLRCMPRNSNCYGYMPRSLQRRPRALVWCHSG